MFNTPTLSQGIALTLNNPKLVQFSVNHSNPKPYSTGLRVFGLSATELGKAFNFPKRLDFKTLKTLTPQRLGS